MATEHLPQRRLGLAGLRSRTAVITPHKETEDCDTCLARHEWGGRVAYALKPRPPGCYRVVTTACE